MYTSRKYAGQLLAKLEEGWQVFDRKYGFVALVILL
jgi:hypothetical protein